MKLKTTRLKAQAIQQALTIILDGVQQPTTLADGKVVITRKPFKLSGKTRVSLTTNLRICREAAEDFETMRKSLEKEIFGEEGAKRNKDGSIRINGDADPDAEDKSELITDGEDRENFKKFEKQLTQVLEDPDFALEGIVNTVKLSDVLGIDPKDAEKKDAKLNAIPGTALDRVLPFLVDDISEKPAKKEKKKDDAASDDDDQE